MQDPFVPPSFEVPDTYVWSDFHLEPLGEQHNERDHAAWMSSVDFIGALPGMHRWAGRWPVPMSLEANMEDLVRHRAEFEARTEFAYSVLDGDDVVGCLYIDPGKDTDALVMSWVTESHAELDQVMRGWVADWLETVWPFETVEYDLD